MRWWERGRKFLFAASGATQKRHWKTQSVYRKGGPVSLRWGSRKGTTDGRTFGITRSFMWGSPRQRGGPLRKGWAAFTGLRFGKGKVSEPGFGLGKNHLRYGLRSESESVTFGSRKLESAQAGFGREPREGGCFGGRSLGVSRVGAGFRRPQSSVVSCCSQLVPRFSFLVSRFGKSVA